MKLPKLPNPGSLIDAKYTAEQMKAYALKAMMAENVACEKICEKWHQSLVGEPEMLKIAEEIKARRTA